MLEYYVSLSAIAVFAITGALAASQRDVSFFALLVLGVTTAIGGGTLRDTILNQPVFWVADLAYVWVAITMVGITFVVLRFLGRTHRLFMRTGRLLLYLDGFGVALFSIQGMKMVLTWGFDPIVALMMGVISAIGGGLLRDILSGRPNLLMTRELYASLLLLGGICYLSMLRWLPVFPFPDYLAMALVFLMRAAAVRWHLNMPGWLMITGRA